MPEENDEGRRNPSPGRPVARPGWRALLADATGVTIAPLKPCLNAFRVRAKVGRDFSDYSAAVAVTVT